MFDISYKDTLELYENGKQRRYNLLFSVNGGAFAIAAALADHDGKGPEILGHMTLGSLSAGMAIFTCVMVADIFMFGLRMRAVQKRAGHEPDLFEWQGQLVLLLLGVLLVAGWLIAWLACTDIVVLLIVLLVLAILSGWWLLRKRDVRNEGSELQQADKGSA